MLFAVHEVAQAVLEAHGRLLGHGAGVPAWHLPAPSQLPRGVLIPPEHETVPQLMPSGWKRHAPPVPQVPSNPHVLLVSRVHSASGSVPVVTSRQYPSATPVFAREHATQVPVHALSQQNPSTQLPDWHWLLPLHAVPMPFLPPQTPAMQAFPTRQSASVAQAVLQTVADAQTRLPGQDVAVPGEHAPELHEP